MSTTPLSPSSSFSASDELPVIGATQELVNWTFERTMRFSRTQRIALGERMERRILDVLELLILAKYGRDQRED